MKIRGKNHQIFWCFCCPWMINVFSPPNINQKSCYKHVTTAYIALELWGTNSATFWDWCYIFPKLPHKHNNSSQATKPGWTGRQYNVFLMKYHYEIKHLIFFLNSPFLSKRQIVFKIPTFMFIRACLTHTTCFPY